MSRVVLKRLMEADVTDAYVGWLNNPLVNRYLESRWAEHSLETVKAFVKSLEASNSDYLFGIFLADTSQHIGNIKLSVNHAHSRGDVGFLIGETAMWGKGYATEAIEEATRFAFETLKLRKVTAGIYANNPGSYRALKKAGYVDAGRFKAHCLTTLDEQDGYVDELLVEQLNPACYPVVAVLQARASSRRLPGKVLQPILNEPMLYRQIERILRAKNISQLVVATSTALEDDAIEQLCLSKGIVCSRGSLEDVLDRFYQAAAPYQPTHVVRLTGDCPLADPVLIDTLIEAHLASGVDYTSNILKPTYPDGLDVEVMRFAALKNAWQEAVLPSHREHVTPFIHQQPGRFILQDITQDKDFSALRWEYDLSALRWTVDEPEDFALINHVYEALYPGNTGFTTEDILMYLAAHPEVLALNQHHTRNAGMQASLEKDSRFLQEAKP